MILDENNMPETEEVTSRVKSDILQYGIATFNRHIPSSFDGLKPGARRVLYVCYENKIYSLCKVNKLAGYVAGYHPHGDAAIADTIIKMAQDGVTANHALLYPEGSFGNLSDLNAASPRYISTKVSAFGWDCVVSLMDNYSMEMTEAESDFGDKEPVFLPSKVPLVLINGIFGIAESFTSNVPQHNLGEVIDRLVKYIKNKNVSAYELARGFYPDYVVGGTIINGDELPKYYYDSTSGNGVIRVRGDAEIDNVNNRIIVRSMPISYDFDSLISQVKKCLNEKDSSGNPKNLVLSNIVYIGEDDDNKKSKPYVFISCKNGTNLVEVLDHLYKNTNLEFSNKINLTMNYNGKIKQSTLKVIFEDWYRANYENRRRKIVHRTAVLSKRLHILEGLRQVYPNIDEIIKLLRFTKGSKDDVILELKKKFKLTLLQSKGIYEMNLGALGKRSSDELTKSIDNLILELKANADSLLCIDDAMIEDALVIKSKYARPRRTRVISKLTEREDVVISSGAILATRNSVGIFDSSNIISGKKILNGFKGVKVNGVYVKEMVGSHRIDDNISAVALFFDNGNATLIQPSSVNCWIPIQTDDGNYVKSVCPVYNNIEGSAICITTDGSLKRFELSSLTNRNVNIATVIENCVFVPNGQEDSTILLTNDEGQCLRIKVSEVPVKGRTSQGVMSSFKSGVGVKMALVRDDSHYVILLENKKLGDGYAFTREIADIGVGSRTSKLKKLYDFNDFKCTGISTVDLSVKEQVGLFISENSTSSLKTSNLKNLKTPRKINCRAFDFIGIEVS